jgi:hypothetical protein
MLGCEYGDSLAHAEEEQLKKVGSGCTVCGRGLMPQHAHLRVSVGATPGVCPPPPLVIVFQGIRESAEAVLAVLARPDPWGGIDVILAIAEHEATEEAAGTANVERYGGCQLIW